MVVTEHRTIRSERECNMADAIRHICGLSGGKDSSALAIYLRSKVPEMEYFFCDTGAELPETYEYLTRLEVVLGKPIIHLNAQRGFDHWFEVFRGTLPSPSDAMVHQEHEDQADRENGSERRRRFPTLRSASTNPTARATSPRNPTFRLDFHLSRMKSAMMMSCRILADAGIGLPAYYEWRTRSGCYFCFYQRKAEWIGLAERHPDLFERAVAIERKTLRDAGIDGDARLRQPGHARSPIHMVGRGNPA